MTTLFQIGDELASLAALCNECEGDISDPAVIDVLESWFKELETDQAAKLDSYVGLLRTWEMEEAASREEGERWVRRAEVRANRISRLKARLLEYLTATGQGKAETASGRIVAVQKNGGLAPILPAGWESGVDLDRYPEFSKRVLDPKAVRDALNNGKVLPFASFGERGAHVRIK